MNLTQLTSSMFALVFVVVFPQLKSKSEDHIHLFGTKMVGGTWECKQGKTKGSKHSYQWILGNQFLKVVADNQSIPKSMDVFGVDPKTGKHTWWSFLADGTTAQTPLTAGQDENGVFTWTKTDGDGKVLMDIDIAFTGEDRLDGNGTEDGQPVKEIWERSKDTADDAWLYAGQPAKIPTSLSAFARTAGPKWISGINAEGEMVNATSFGTWIHGGKFYVYASAAVNGDQKLSSDLILIGADANSEKAIGWQFNQDGSIVNFTISPNGLDVEGESTTANGDTKAIKGRFEVRDDGLKYSATIDGAKASYMFYDAK